MVAGFEHPAVVVALQVMGTCGVGPQSLERRHPFALEVMLPQRSHLKEGIEWSHRRVGAGPDAQPLLPHRLEPVHVRGALPAHPARVETLWASPVAIEG